MGAAWTGEHGALGSEGRVSTEHGPQTLAAALGPFKHHLPPGSGVEQLQRPVPPAAWSLTPYASGVSGRRWLRGGRTDPTPVSLRETGRDTQTHTGEAV